MLKQEQNSTHAPVPITGMGCITAAGGTLNESLASIFGAGCYPMPPAKLITDHSIKYPVFEVPDVWLAAQVREPHPDQRCADLAWIAAQEALSMAGLGDPGDRNSLRIGICLGTVVGAALEDGAFYPAFHAGGCPSPRPVLEFLLANPAFLLRERLGVTGPYMTVTTGCTSGASAICQAVEWLKSGVCDAVIAGGTEKLSRLSYNGFASLSLLDSERCRPFDRDRDGVNLGEGAGVVLLEHPDLPARRGARPIGTLLGAGNACDAYHLSRPHFEGIGLYSALMQALEKAAVKPQDIAFINAHGTGTLDNDRMEGRLFKTVLPGVPFQSMKSHIGHTLGAAGGIEAVLSLACLNMGRVPASPGLIKMDPEIGVAPLTTAMGLSEKSGGKGRIALSTSVAYGGNNIALLFGVNEEAGEFSPEGRLSEPYKGAAGFNAQGRRAIRANSQPRLPGLSFSANQPRAEGNSPLISRPVSVCGIGVAGGFGCGRERLKDALANPPGPNATVMVRTPSGDDEVPAFLCDTAPLEEYVPRKKLRRVDHFSRMTALGVAMALDDAGMRYYDPTRIGVILATGYGANDTTFRFVDGYLDYGDSGASPLLFSGSGHSGALSNTTILLGITGPILTICQPQLASTAAVITARQWLKSDLADVVVVGNVEEYFPVRGYGRRACCGRVRDRNISPFEFDRESGIAGEGMAFMVLSDGRQKSGDVEIASIDFGTHLSGSDPAINDDNIVLLGVNGDKCQGELYTRCLSDNNLKRLSYAPLFGTMPSSFFMHGAIAALAIGEQYLPVPPGSSFDPGINGEILMPGEIACLEVSKNDDFGLLRLSCVSHKKSISSAD